MAAGSDRREPKHLTCLTTRAGGSGQSYADASSDRASHQATAKNLFLKANSPASPTPKSTNVPGSGTGANGRGVGVPVPLGPGITVRPPLKPLLPARWVVLPPSSVVQPMEIVLVSMVTA